MKIAAPAFAVAFFAAPAVLACPAMAASAANATSCGSCAGFGGYVSSVSLGVLIGIASVTIENVLKRRR